MKLFFYRPLEKYLEKYHKDEVMNSESLQKEARSLLNIRSEIKGALVSAETGHPLIFGLEVQAPKDKLSQIENNKLVKLSSTVVGKAIGIERPKLKPESLKAEYNDPVIQTTSPQDLYDLISAAIN